MQGGRTHPIHVQHLTAGFVAFSKRFTAYREGCKLPIFNPPSNNRKFHTYSTRVLYRTHRKGRIYSSFDVLVNAKDLETGAFFRCTADFPTRIGLKWDFCERKALLLTCPSIHTQLPNDTGPNTEKIQLLWKESACKTAINISSLKPVLCSFSRTFNPTEIFLLTVDIGLDRNRLCLYIYII